MRGKIQLSASTVKELIREGRSHLITAREDKVIAKGKGAMETFSLHIPADSAKTPRNDILLSDVLSASTGEPSGSSDSG